MEGRGGRVRGRRGGNTGGSWFKWPRSAVGHRPAARHAKQPRSAAAAPLVFTRCAAASLTLCNTPAAAGGRRTQRPKLYERRMNGGGREVSKYQTLFPHAATSGGHVTRITNELRDAQTWPPRRRNEFRLCASWSDTQRAGRGGGAGR